MNVEKTFHFNQDRGMRYLVRLGVVLGGFFMFAATALQAQTTDFGIETWRWDCGTTNVTVSFTTNVNATLAVDPANYSFNPPVTIFNIIHAPPSAVVELEVSPISTSGITVLTVTNLTSDIGEPLDPQYTQAFLYCHDHSPMVDCPDDVIIDCAPAGGVTTNLTVVVFDDDGDPLTVVWNVNGQDVATHSVPGGTPVTSDTDSLTYTYPLGTNSVMVTVTDGTHTNGCDFRVIVNPAGPPLIDCPQGPFEIFGADCANPVVFDLSSLITIQNPCYTTNDFTFTHSPAVGTVLPHGTNLVTLTVFGPNNFEQECDVLFIVDCPDDDDPCEVLCPDDLFFLNIVDCPALMPDVTQYVTLSGNCDLSQYTLTQDIPVGTPLGNGVHWVNVNVTGPGGFDEDCRIQVIVECDEEPPPGGPCDTLLAAIPVNTGWDHNTGTTYNIGDVDAFWTVIDDPDAGTTEPRPAFVINQHSAWQPAMPNSRWISAYAGSANNLNGAYDLEFIFCLVEGWSDAVVDIALRVDDRAEVYLNGTLIGQTPLLFSFSSPTPTTILENNQALFQTGANSLVVRMINSHGVAMGLNLAGEVRADGLTLEDPLCCDPGSSISGQKFYDANQNGIFDPTETVLAGWTIEATDGTNVWTSVTDVNGYYYFMGLPPGTYTITEVQQPNYIQTAPLGNSHTVTVGLAQGVSGLDFGNFREIKEPNQPPIVECPPDLLIDCVYAGTNVTLTANFSDADGDPLSYSWYINGSFYTSGGIPAGGPPTIGSSTITPYLTVGTHVITVTVNDGSAEDACTFTVVIEEIIPPRLGCRNQGVIVLPVNLNCEAILPPLPYSVMTGCTPLNDLIVTQTPPTGTVLAPGTHWVIVEVYDPVSGDSVFCRFEVLVENRRAPWVVCPQVDPVEECEAVIPDLIPDLYIFSHCDPVADLTIVQTPPPGTPVGPGSHVITITVTDTMGNTRQCTTVFEVLAIGFGVPIEGLFNTGVSTNGTLLPLMSVDPNYELTTSADASTPGPAAYAVNLPHPTAWVANTPVSQWIAPTNVVQFQTSGLYVYEIEFTLPASFTSASISGAWATDNSAAIYLNGVATGITKPATGFGSLTPFTIATGFQAGVNVLEFRVTALPSSWGQDFFSGLHVSNLEGTVFICDPDPPCEPPTVVVTPTPGQVGIWGGSATFTATVGGTPPHTYQWYFDGNPIPLATGPSLTISPLTFANAGWYSVLVMNDCGEIWSQRVWLRVRRPRITVIDLWDFVRPAPLPNPSDPPPVIGDFGTPLDPLPLGPDPLAPYEDTAVASQFGKSGEFGIPAPEGVPVDVMQFSYGLRDTGYALSYDPAELPQQTIVLDLYAPESVCMLPLVHVDSAEGEDMVIYLCVGSDQEPTPGYPVLQIPTGTWSRVVIAWDTEWNHLSGYVLLPEGATVAFALDGVVPPGTGVIRLLPSGELDHGVLYLHSMAWFDHAFSILDVVSQGASGSAGVSGTDPLREQASVEVEASAGPGGLRLRWRTGDFLIQQSTNLIDWETVAIPPTLVSETDSEVEYRIDLPDTEADRIFYRGISGLWDD